MKITSKFSILLLFCVFNVLAEDNSYNVPVSNHGYNYTSDGNMSVTGTVTYVHHTFKARSSITFSPPFYTAATMTAQIDYNAAPYPTITVNSADPHAYFAPTAAPGHDRVAKWEITRSGNPSNELTVDFTLTDVPPSTGAVNTVHYNLSTPNGIGLTANKVTFPIGVNTITIILTPVVYHATTGHRYAKLALTNGVNSSGYRFAPLTFVSATIWGDNQGGGGDGGGLPVISTVVRDGLAYEALTPPEVYETRYAELEISRSGSTASTLTVYFQINPTNPSPPNPANTSEYVATVIGGSNLSSTSATFNAGQSKMTIRITPADDGIVDEPLETVRYVLQPHANYFIAEGQSTATVSIVNNQLIQFSAAPNPVAVGDGVQFFYQPLGLGLYTYYWSFGDTVAYPGSNVITSTSTISHVYNTPGTYTATAWTYTTAGDKVIGTIEITVMGGFGGRSANQQPSILSAPWANPNPTVFPAATSVNVVAVDPDKGPSALTYTWSKVSGPGDVTFDANGTETANSSQASFSKPGSYSVKVVVSDGKDTAEGLVPIVVSPPPAVKKNDF